MSAPVDYFDSESLRKDLKGKTVRGGAMIAVAQAASVAISLVTIPILARLLQKEDFGLVAMVTVFTGFAAMFVDAGLASATVQKDKIRPEQATNLFWMSTCLGLLIAAVVAAASPLIAWFYDEPRLVAITLALTGSFVTGGLRIQHNALLKRAMRFKQITLIGLTATVIGFTSGILWAWSRRGQEDDYWALVIIPLATGLTSLLLTWGACDWRPGLPRRGVGTRSMVEFGANLTGFSFLNYFVRNADNLLIGWWWGPELLGVYERAYKLFLTPMRTINAPVAGVMVPALSRLTDDPPRYRRYYLGVVSKLALVTVPPACFMVSSADLVVAVVLGPGWDSAAPILRALSVVGVVQVIGNTFGWLYTSQGRTADMLKWVMMAGPVLILSFLVGLSWGPLGVAVSYCLTCLFGTFPANVLYTTRVGPVRARDVASLFPAPVLVGLAAGGGAMLEQLAPLGASPVIRLALAMTFALIFALAAVWLIPSTRRAIRELLSMTQLRFQSHGKQHSVSDFREG